MQILAGSELFKHPPQVGLGWMLILVIVLAGGAYLKAHEEHTNLVIAICSVAAFALACFVIVGLV